MGLSTGTRSRESLLLIHCDGDRAPAGHQPRKKRRTKAGFHEKSPPVLDLILNRIPTPISRRKSQKVTA